ncbi:MAG: glycosyltransferase family 4 protein [Pseudomonadota bacterium]
MKILLCHNSYKLHGGEDVVYQSEGRLLQDKGHEVIRYHRSNDELDTLGRIETLQKLFWNRETEADVSELIVRERPDILHCTNTFPLISPSIYKAAKIHKVPVIQSLHNYRLICPSATQLRNGLTCKDCSGKRFAWPAVYHQCYRNSRTATAATAAMLGYHHFAGTWSKLVDRYIVLTEYMKQNLVNGGLIEEKLRVKPNFVGNDTGPGVGKGGYAVFAGRLSEEKGIRILLDAWSGLASDTQLHILGDGPLMSQIKAVARLDSRIVVHGHTDQNTAFEIIGDASFLIVPSICQETFGLCIIEAYAKGTPVIASDIGSFPDLIKPMETGLLFETGDFADLRQKVENLLQNRPLSDSMRVKARTEFENAYTADQNYKILRSIYDEVLKERAQTL